MLLTTMPGRINTYISALKMENQWRERRSATANAKPAPDTDRWSAAVAAEESTQESETKLERIVAKVDAGRDLTPAERRYLKEKDPDTYALLVQEEQEQRAFEAAVKSCRTKEELERLHLWRVGRSMKTVKEIERNTELSPERKLKLAMREKRLLTSADERIREAAAAMGKDSDTAPAQGGPWIGPVLIDCDRKSLSGADADEYIQPSPEWTKELGEVLYKKSTETMGGPAAETEETEEAKEGKESWQQGWSLFA